MHELSIAYELARMIQRHIPEGAELTLVKVRIGPMHGINADALARAWEVVRLEVGWPTAQLSVDIPPWRLKCPSCGRSWQPAVIDEHCTCGEIKAQIMGGDEFLLVAIDVKDDGAATAGEVPAVDALAKLHAPV